MGPLDWLVGIFESLAVPDWRHGLVGDPIRFRFRAHYFVLPDGACRDCSEAFDHPLSDGSGAGANQ